MLGKLRPRITLPLQARFTPSIRAQYASDTAVFIGLTYAVNIPILTRRFLVELSRQGIIHPVLSTFVSFRYNLPLSVEKGTLYLTRVHISCLITCVVVSLITGYTASIHQ